MAWGKLHSRSLTGLIWTWTDVEIQNPSAHELSREQRLSLIGTLVQIFGFKSMGFQWVAWAKLHSRPSSGIDMDLTWCWNRNSICTWAQQRADIWLNWHCWADLAKFQARFWIHKLAASTMGQIALQIIYWHWYGPDLMLRSKIHLHMDSAVSKYLTQQAFDANFGF